MADARRRELERAVARGEDQAALRLLGEHLRTGSALPRERLELAAYLLLPQGPTLVDRPLGALPSHLFHKDGLIPLQTVRRAGDSHLQLRLYCLDPGLDAARLRVTGYLGSRTTSWYEQALTEVCQLGVRRLLLDLNHCPGVSSSGLGSILRLHEQLQRENGALAVLLNPAIRLVIDMLGLGSFLGIATSEDEALRAVLDPSGAPVVLDGDAWLGRLLRWGPQVALRGALAAARALTAREPTTGDAVRQALAAAEAWLKEPGPALAEKAQAAADAALAQAQLLTPAQAAVHWWAVRAAHLAGSGIWPQRLPEPLPAQRAVVRQELLCWALGIGGE